MSTAPSTSLWRHHDFRQIWMGDTVSVLGMQLVGFAMPILAINLLGARDLQVGVLEASSMLAFLLISLHAGAYVDRWRKKRVIVAGDLLRAGLLLSVPAAYALDVLSMEQLYVLAFLTGVVTVFFDVANQSFLPQLVAPDQISDGNGKLQASQQVAIIAGPPLAGALVVWIGSPWTIAITSVCMAASSLLVSRVHAVEQLSPREERRPLRQEIAEGMRFVLGHPLLRRIVACTGLSNFGSGVYGALFVLFLLTDLGLNEATVGLVMGVGGAGGILGALSASRFTGLVGEGRAVPLSAVVFALSTVAVPVSLVLPTVPTLMTGSFVLSWAVVVYNVTQVSFRQRLCPTRLLGRMNASIRFLVWGPIPLGALAGGLVGEAFGTLSGLWLGIVVSGMSTVPVLLSPLVRMRDLPSGLAAEPDRGVRG